MYSNLSPTIFFYIAWLFPKHIIGEGLKLPLNKGSTEEPLYLSYDLLTEMIKSDHGNNSLFLLAFKELYCRILYQDIDKSIATDKFFKGSKSDLTLNALSYSDCAKAQILRTKYQLEELKNFLEESKLPISKRNKLNTLLRPEWFPRWLYDLYLWVLWEIRL